MQFEVNIHQLRAGIRYTFTYWDGRVFRARLETYQTQHGKQKQALRLRDVDRLEGALCIPLSYVRMAHVYALPNSIPFFPYLIPEVNMLINQCV
jgi:hypothetical protein